VHIHKQIIAYPLQFCEVKLSRSSCNRYKFSSCLRMYLLV
jgi:hypothetical protein